MVLIDNDPLLDCLESTLDSIRNSHEFLVGLLEVWLHSDILRFRPTALEVDMECSDDLVHIKRRETLLDLGHFS